MSHETTFNEYQDLAQRTSSYPGRVFADESKPHDVDSAGVEGTMRVINALLGLTGEAGECADYMKKVLFHGHSLDKEKMKRELGDVQWYCAELASALGLTLDEVAQANIQKLRARYPEGFDPARSKNRPIEE